MAAGVIFLKYGRAFWNRKAKPVRRKKRINAEVRMQNAKLEEPQQVNEELEVSQQVDEELEIKNEEATPSTAESVVLEINDAEEMREYIEKMRDVSSIEKYLDNFDEEANWCRTALSKLSKELDKSEEVMLNYYEHNGKGLPAEKIISIVSKLMSPLQTCYRTRENYQGMIDVIEDYLKTLKIIKALNPNTGEEFKPGDRYEDWVELELNMTPIANKTNEPELHNKIARVELPPYCFHYIDENGEEATTYIGGQCIVYSYQEGDFND